MSHSTRPALCIILLVSSFLSSPCIAQDEVLNSQGNTESAAELGAIRAESEAFVAAFNNKDAKAVAALWTEDGQYTDEFGAKFDGRDEIEKGYATFFTDNPNARIRIFIDSLRLFGNGVAIEDGRAVLDPPPEGAPGISKYTAVHVKADGKWLMAAVRDTWIATPSAHANVADLEWLIGTWSAEEHGARTESLCRWVANKSFIQRSYCVTHDDGTSASGVQLIGWNPQGGHLQSWNFSSDGGHAVGVWSPVEDGWIAETQGVTGNGTPTSSVNILTRLDDNAYVWQSVQRTAGGITLPDTGQVVLKRQPSNH